MLCQFTFRNYRSYKNETTLDMQAVSQGFEDSLLKSDKDSKEFLPVAVIYGPNAGGKSNVLNALACVLNIVTLPLQALSGIPLNTTPYEKATPFAFDEFSKEEPTEFELFFRPNDIYEYKYSIAILNDVVAKESLHRKKIGASGRIAKIFERKNGKIELGASISKSNINSEVNERMPYLSFLAINYKLEPVTTAMNCFENCGFLSGDLFLLMMYKLIAFEINDTTKKRWLELMNNVGINISDFEIEKNPGGTPGNIFFKHTVAGNTYLLDYTMESEGTRKFFNLVPYIILTLDEGGVFIFDELDSKLHPKLLKFIIMLFKNPEINKHGAQLIFTSHDVSTMKSSVFRTDEIWFACKQEDESSDLYSLSELRDESNNHISPKAAFDKQYLEGRYGADPYFSSMMNWG